MVELALARSSLSSTATTMNQRCPVPSSSNAWIASAVPSLVAKPASPLSALILAIVAASAFWPRSFSSGWETQTPASLSRPT